jgi:hypothetical protein
MDVIDILLSQGYEIRFWQTGTVIECLLALGDSEWRGASASRGGALLEAVSRLKEHQQKELANCQEQAQRLQGVINMLKDAIPDTLEAHV